MSDPPLFHPANVLGAPGSSFAGLAAILAVVNSAVSHGVPTTGAGWLAFGISLLSGIGAIFAKAS